MAQLCDTDIQEQLSLAYVRAIAAVAGFTVAIPELDRDSIDLQIGSTGAIVATSKFNSANLGIQLKAYKVDLSPNAQSFSYRLKVKNYNDLRTPRQVPAILVVFVMPKAKKDWIDHTSDHMKSRTCAYWLSLLGMPQTHNGNTVTVSMNTGNCLSPATLRKMMVNISLDKDVGDGL